jgi:hypothetical protein
MAEAGAATSTLAGRDARIPFRWHWSFGAM